MENNYKLTEIQLATMEHMNDGAYLIKDAGAEGVTYNPNSILIQTRIKSGTVAALLEKGLVRQHLAVSKKYVLTDEGRKYKKVK